MRLVSVSGRSKFGLRLSFAYIQFLLYHALWDKRRELYYSFLLELLWGDLSIVRPLYQQ